MVSSCYDIGSGLQETSSEPRGDAGPVGRVLTVHDAEVDLSIGANRREMLLDSLASRRAEDVGEEQNSQGSATLAAGRSSMCT